jgi:hypothetical protein
MVSLYRCRAVLPPVSFFGNLIAADGLLDVVMGRHRGYVTQEIILGLSLYTDTEAVLQQVSD